MSDDGGKERPARPSDDYRRNFAERLFPGPSNPMSKQAAENVERLLRSRRGTRGTDTASVVPTAPSSRTSAQADPAATAEDVAHLRETLDAQNELLQAILSASVDTQTDARATAQNSRTFAWAGTAIAFLTLVATVILLIAALNGH